MTKHTVVITIPTLDDDRAFANVAGHVLGVFPEYGFDIVELDDTGTILASCLGPKTHPNRTRTAMSLTVEAATTTAEAAHAAVGAVTAVMKHVGLGDHFPQVVRVDRMVAVAHAAA